MFQNFKYEIACITVYENVICAHPISALRPLPNMLWNTIRRAQSVLWLQNTPKIRFSARTPLGELKTLPRTPYSAGKGTPLPYLTRLGAFSASILPPSELAMRPPEF